MSEENDAPFVRITNREIWEGLQSVTAEVKDLKLQMNLVLKENVDIKKEYGHRLRALELKVYTLLSGTVTASALLVKVGFFS